MAQYYADFEPSDMGEAQELHTNDGEVKSIRLPPCPLCGSALKAGHIGNSHTKSQKLQVKCTSKSCRIERTDATIHGGIDDLIGYQEKAWNPWRNEQ